MGIKRNTSHHAFRFNLLNDAVKVGASLIMYVHYFSVKCFDFINELFGAFNHKVYIEWLGSMLSHSLHDGETE